VAVVAVVVEVAVRSGEDVLEEVALQDIAKT
jgi:hypothetical protein